MNLQNLLTDEHPTAEHKDKLSEEQKVFVVSEIAKKRTSEEVALAVLNKYDIKITRQCVDNYRNAKKWQPIIREVEEQYLSNIGEVAGAHKRIRIERYEEMYKELRKSKDQKGAAVMLNYIKEEVEGSQSEVNLSLTFNNLHLMSEDELEKRRNEIVNKLKRLNIVDAQKVETEE